MSAEKLHEELLSHLKCPVCLETLSSPIYMCTNGHGVCAECQPHLVECSTCRARGKPNLRNKHLEKIATLLKFPCENKQRGCTLTFNIEDLGKHLPLCNYGLRCLICTVVIGSVQNLKEHVKKNHRTQFKQCSTDGTLPSVCVGKIVQNYDSVVFNMVHYNNDIFWLKTRYKSKARKCFRSLCIVSNEAKEASGRYSVECIPIDVGSMRRVLDQADKLIGEPRKDRSEIFLPPCTFDEGPGEGSGSYTYKLLHWYNE